MLPHSYGALQSNLIRFRKAFSFELLELNINVSYINVHMNVCFGNFKLGILTYDCLAVVKCFWSPLIMKSLDLVTYYWSHASDYNEDFEDHILI